MRWLLLPLLLLALAAPRQECPTRPTIPVAENTPGAVAGQLIPPLRAGNRVAPLGTDRLGRDAACLNARGLRRSLGLALLILLLALVPGTALGLWLAWHPRWRVPSGEVLVLLAFILLLGTGSFRLVLTLGVTLLLSRLVAVRAATVLKQPFIEGALALGGSTRQILTRHVLPHLWPSFPVILATALSGIFIWLMELGALGFHDQSTVQVAFTDGLDLVQDVQTLPLNADLGQLVSFFRWTWLDTPEQLVWPALLLTLLTLALKDLVRWVMPRLEGSFNSRPR